MIKPVQSYLPTKAKVKRYTLVFLMIMLGTGGIFSEGNTANYGYSARQTTPFYPKRKPKHPLRK